MPPKLNGKTPRANKVSTGDDVSKLWGKRSCASTAQLNVHAESDPSALAHNDATTSDESGANALLVALSARTRPVWPSSRLNT